MTRSTKHKASKASSIKTTATLQQSQALADFDDQQDTALLALHVIRILALYLYVLLARLPQPGEINLHDIFFPETTTVERLVESTASKIEQQVHVTVLACVQGEITSNQFDGLIQEKTVFAAIKRLFRQHKVQMTTQCRLLVRLLNRYLTQLTYTPIVRCEAMSMLASTLEYISRGDMNQCKTPTSSMSLLYPLVNAIDSLSIEQRECLDALTTLWRWLETCEPSTMLLNRIVHHYHKIIFFIEPNNTPKTATTTTSSEDLGVCFVRTLVRHADHIFRHDLGFTDPQDLLSSDSDTEDDSTLPHLPTPPSTPPPKKALPTTFSPSKTKKKTKAEVKAPIDEPAVVVIDANEPVPANMMRVGIAAAAGTLAAALCVIFT